MRSLLFLLLLLLSGATAKESCLVSDFYGLSWLGNPTERHQRLSDWLTINGNACSTDQLLAIWNNLAMWGGTADSGELRGKVLFYYARALEREKK
jgi:hypothetical protein